MQKISLDLDAYILTAYPRELYLHDDLLRGFTHIDPRLQIACLRGSLPSPGLMDEFLKQPTDLFLHWEKWPGWQLFPHIFLLYISAEAERCETQPPINRHRLLPSYGTRRLARYSSAHSRGIISWHITVYQRVRRC